MVAHHRNGSAFPKRARRAAHGVRVVNDLHANLAARSAHVRVDEWVGHAACYRGERHTARSHIRATQLPVAEVTGDEDDAFAQRVGGFPMLPSFNQFKAIEDRLSRCARQHRGLDERATETLIRLSRRVEHLGGRVLRKGGGDLPFSDPPSDADGLVGEPCQRRSHAARRAPAHQSQEGDGRPRGRELDSVGDGRASGVVIHVRKK